MYKNKFSDGRPENKAVAAAFSWALKDHIEVLRSDIVLHPHEEEHGGESYLKYAEEKRGYEIGKAINENKEVHNFYDLDELMGRKLIKEVFVIKVNKKH